MRQLPFPKNKYVEYTYLFFRPIIKNFDKRGVNTDIFFAGCLYFFKKGSYKKTSYTILTLCTQLFNRRTEIFIQLFNSIITRQTSQLLNAGKIKLINITKLIIISVTHEISTFLQARICCTHQSAKY